MDGTIIVSENAIIVSQNVPQELGWVGEENSVVATLKLFFLEKPLDHHSYISMLPVFISKDPISVSHKVQLKYQKFLPKIVKISH